ncbi:hypothetical protein CO726_30610 [Bacillus fungorum]|uniref:Uncharacterized protein n=1 Tax=Bacillus fungorum TaxID=2039284 RepID=A0A2G6Q4I2_9BACI|nr:hypothetical protein [Bacillus fungorum]PIE91726.1 hypothetical protein CO726_30610 [Bacillus fungorum]
MENQEKLVVLDKDAKAVVTKELESLFFAAKQMYDWVKTDSLTEEMKETLLNLSEHHIAKVSNKVKYNSLSAANLEEKHAAVREANGRIRDLEEKIANMLPIDGLKEQLEKLSRTIDHWWDDLGFNYVREIQYTKYGNILIEFGFSLDPSFSSRYSDSPLSDAELQQRMIDDLKERGFDFYEEGRRDYELIDNDNNRNLLIELLEERFPSMRLREFTNMAATKDHRILRLRGVKIIISDLNDILKEENQTK